MGKERELFEGWYQSAFGETLHRIGNEYSSLRATNMWSAWQASAQREGFALVPVEPSEAMTDAGLNCEHNIDDFVVINEIYKAMIEEGAMK